MTKKEILIGVGALVVISGLGYYFFVRKKDGNVLVAQPQEGEAEEQQSGGSVGGGGGGGSMPQEQQPVLQQPQIVDPNNPPIITPTLGIVPTIITTPIQQGQSSPPANATSANLMPVMTVPNPKSKQVRGIRANANKGYGISAGGGVKGMSGGMMNLNVMNNKVVHTGII